MFEFGAELMEGASGLAEEAATGESTVAEEGSSTEETKTPDENESQHNKKVTKDEEPLTLKRTISTLPKQKSENKDNIGKSILDSLKSISSLSSEKKGGSESLLSSINKNLKNISSTIKNLFEFNKDQARKKETASAIDAVEHKDAVKAGQSDNSSSKNTNNILDAIIKKIGGIAIQFLAPLIMPTIGLIVNAFKGLKVIVDNIVDAFKSAANTVSSTLVGMINFVIDKINKIFHTHIKDLDTSNTTTKSNNSDVKSSSTGSNVAVSGTSATNIPQSKSTDTGPTHAVPQSNTIRSSAEQYLGRKLSDKEYDYLVRATRAESTSNPKEQSYVMATILNRARDSHQSVVDVLKAKNQFQSVTGTKANNHQESKLFKDGPDAKSIKSMEGGVSEYLSDIPHNYTNFTAASSKAYGKGTNIGYREQLIKSGGTIIGGTVFAPGTYKARKPSEYSPPETSTKNIVPDKVLKDTQTPISRVHPTLPTPGHGPMNSGPIPGPGPSGETNRGLQLAAGRFSRSNPQITPQGQYMFPKNTEIPNPNADRGLLDYVLYFNAAS